MIGIYTNIRGAFGIFISTLVGLIYVIIKSIYIKNEFPDMPQISRKENPLLFKIIDKVSEITNSEKIDYVYLGDDNNCGISRITIGFKSYNILFIGIYSLKLLNQEELKSVLLHELSCVDISIL